MLLGPAALVAKTVYRGHDAGASCEGTETVVGRNGDAVTYCFVVTNNGDVPLSPVTVTDPDLGIDESGITFVEIPSKNRETALQNGEVAYYVGTYTLNDARKQLVSFAAPYSLPPPDML